VASRKELPVRPEQPDHREQTDHTQPPERADLPEVPRVHRAARVEDALHRAVEPRLRRRGWHVAIVAYPGYGSTTWVRVLARVVVTRVAPRRKKPAKVRGWRSFTTVPVKHTRVRIHAGDQIHEISTDRTGFIDCRVPANLEPGWGRVRLTAADAEDAEAPVRILDPDLRFGVVSDIDDTVMVTALPRPLLAAWNTFVLDEHARMAVPGMAVLYERLVNAHPGAPVFYLSTGAWNVAPTLTRFLSRHLYPAGPLLLTNWGPTQDSWFRSGREHKKATLKRLADEFPDVKWLLVGDDGQHDEEIYAEFAQAHPEQVAAVAIRHLSPTQSMLAGTMPGPSGDSATSGPGGHPLLYAPDGAGLWRLLSDEKIV
jgi:phosphatidate phosphatase APP1